MLVGEEKFVGKCSMQMCTEMTTRAELIVQIKSPIIQIFYSNIWSLLFMRLPLLFQKKLTKVYDVTDRTE